MTSSLPIFRRLAAAAVVAMLVHVSGLAKPQAAAEPAIAAPRDAFVVLSGGASPLQNNYSQYLQAKAVLAFFARNYPEDAVWVFFGAGNRPGQPAALADVRRQYKRDGLVLESWLPGPLPGNRPAKRAEILRALREEILPRVSGGGTLFLFVGDHGEKSKADEKKGTRAESIINLWGMERRQPDNDASWWQNGAEALGVDELRREIAAGIGRGRVVFCMTQCHSGGFHHLGVPRTVRPNPAWFKQAPEWARTVDDTICPAAAGFSATDEDSLAAGCDPDPDPDRWAGYERFVPENLLGWDLFTLERSGPGLRSFAEAHEAATLIDRTIDKPMTSAEAYLERWAELIETRLAADPNLSRRAQRQVKEYQRAVDRGEARGSDARLGERAAQFGRFVDAMGEQNPSAASLLRTGTRRELEAAIAPARGNPGPRGGTARRRASGGLQELWLKTLRPAWQAAVELGAAPQLPAAAVAFERKLWTLENEKRDFFLRPGQPMLNQIYWNSGYAFPATLDVSRAEAVARWGAERRAQITAWGLTSGDPDVHAAAERLAPRRRPRGDAASVASDAHGADSVRPLSRKIAAERALYYRRVLAAWAFLLALDEKPALARLHELIELENTPLPAGDPAQRVRGGNPIIETPSRT